MSKKSNNPKVANPGPDHDRDHEMIESIAFLLSVIDASLTGIGYLKPIRNDSQTIIDFECVFANKKEMEFSGCTDMVGKKYSEIFPGVTETEIFRNYIRALEENIVQDFEVHTKNEKSDHWFRITAVRVGNGIAVSSEDITARKKIERELAAQHNILKQTEELAQAGSWEYDINTKQFSWSDGMYQLFNMKKNTPVVPPVYLKYSTEEELPVAKKIVDAIERNFHPLEETLHIKFNGSIKTLKIKAAQLKNEQGEIEKMLGVDMDITSVQRAEEKIMELNRSLSLMNQELSSLNAELKNFSSITTNNYSEALRQVYIHLETIVTHDARTLSDSGRANLRRAQSAIQKMKLLTNDISNYLQFYDLGIQKQMINPNSIIENILSAMKGKLEDAKATVSKTKLPSFPADPLLFSHLMTHLFDNAIKFRKLIVEPVIKIHYSQADELNAMPKVLKNTSYIIIIISDNGIGFQQEEMDKMFELFYQLPGQGKHKGSGIGLAICKKIMDMHGGIITAEGEPARGASFQCYFPL